MIGNSKAVLVVGMLATILATVAGCGGGGDTTGGGQAGGGSPPQVSSKVISKAEYENSGDAICASVPNEYKALLNELPKKQQENKEIVTPKAALPPLRKAAEGLAKLGSPNGEEKKAQEVVDALEAAADGLEEEPNGELSGPKSSFVEFEKLTKAMGFQICPGL